MKTEAQNAADFMAQRETSFTQRIMNAKKSGKNPTWSGTSADGKRTSLSARHAQQVPEVAKKTEKLVPHHTETAVPSAPLAEYPSCMTWTVVTILVIIGICLCKMAMKHSTHA